MFVEDIKTDFYDVLLGNRVLLLVHYDVDAICACKILQGLFKCDNIAYSLVPVSGVSELKSAYEENNEEVKYVVLVNCGGTIDLVDVLQPEEDVVFFVLDWHKPTDVCNVFSDGQVRLVYRDSEENIPNFDDIFRDDDDENEDEDLGTGREGLEAAVERRRERRVWEEKRNTLMFNYTQFSYYGKPSSCILASLSWRLSRLSCAVVWAGGVGASASSLLCLRSPSSCLIDADDLRRLASLADTGDHSQSARVIIEKDVQLPLYRMWSVEESIKHSPLLGPHLKLHTVSGAGRVRQLLADMGFPLNQARQSFSSMDVALRRSLLDSLESSCSKLRLPSPSLPSFLLQRPHSRLLAAQDLVYLLMAFLELDSGGSNEGFQLCLLALECQNPSSIGAGEEARVRAALLAQRAFQMFVNVPRSVVSTGPFHYFILSRGTTESSVLSGPLWLGLCARWTSSAVRGSRPLVASCDIDSNDCILLGVPPNYHQEPRNLFGAAFEQAATQSGVAISLDYLDSSVIKLPIGQRPQFLDALTALLS